MSGKLRIVPPKILLAKAIQIAHAGLRRDCPGFMERADLNALAPQELAR